MTSKVLSVCGTYSSLIRADKAVDKSIYSLDVQAMIIYNIIFKSIRSAEKRQAHRPYKLTVQMFFTECILPLT